MEFLEMEDDRIRTIDRIGFRLRNIQKSTVSLQQIHWENHEFLEKIMNNAKSLVESTHLEDNSLLLRILSQLDEILIVNCKQFEGNRLTKTCFFENIKILFMRMFQTLERASEEAKSTLMELQFYPLAYLLTSLIEFKCKSRKTSGLKLAKIINLTFVDSFLSLDVPLTIKTQSQIIKILTYLLTKYSHYQLIQEKAVIFIAKNLKKIHKKKNFHQFIINLKTCLKNLKFRTFSEDQFMKLLEVWDGQFSSEHSIYIAKFIFAVQKHESKLKILTYETMVLKLLNFSENSILKEDYLETLSGFIVEYLLEKDCPKTTRDIILKCLPFTSMSILTILKLEKHIKTTLLVDILEKNVIEQIQNLFLKEINNMSQTQRFNSLELMLMLKRICRNESQMSLYNCLLLSLDETMDGMVEKLDEKDVKKLLFWIFLLRKGVQEDIFI